MNKTGFGFLRLPQLCGPDGSGMVDESLLEQMVDAFLEQGGTYFDTAYTYLDGASERAVRTALVQRHPRSSFQIADKLPGWLVRSHEECQRCFDEQLARCGVEFFDVYLLHWLNEENYRICERTDQFAFLRQVKAEGKANRIGFSFHDSPELLERILTEHPEVELVQLQINYLDWNSPSIQAERCYEAAVRHGKRVIVMEPVRGGKLAALPSAAEAPLRTHAPERSVPSWAIRFASSLESVDVVLSGMNTMEQLVDNLRGFEPLTAEEQRLLLNAAEIIRRETAIFCTGCGYCVSGCPMHIPIPRYFALYNDYARVREELWKIQPAYRKLTEGHGRAGDCVSCGQCEAHCPQKLRIIESLQSVSQAFDGPLEEA